MAIVHDKCLVKMEKILLLWMEDTNGKVFQLMAIGSRLPSVSGLFTGGFRMYFLHISGDYSNGNIDQIACNPVTNRKIWFSN